MLFNIIIFFIILIILTLILRYSTQYKEGFFDFPDATHNAYVESSQIKFNQLTNTINLIDPALPVSPDSANAFKIALGGLDAQPTASSYNLKPKTDFVLPQQASGTFEQAKTCESAPTTCDAFDDPTFAENCGMSFDKKGIGADGKPHIGGLFISSADRQKQMNAANNVLSTGGAPYDPYKVYQPTLGKAKSGTFALTKDQCQVVKEKVDCAAKQTFSSPNCTQCYTSQRFARVGPETGRIPSTLYLFGSGNVYVASTNNTITLSITKLDPNNAVTLEIPANAEGTVFSVVAQQPNNTPLPYIAGYIQGQTPRGTFKLDLFNLVETDQVSKAKPKLNGSITVNGFRCLSMIPGTGQTYINLACIMPFSFLSMYDGDALTCDNGPIITQAASATFLESDPCFGKANKPGNYKLECLQTRWIELGGTQQGTGYPANQIVANAIQKDANGNPLEIDTIVNNLAPKMTSASTGQDQSGKNLSITDWNTVSMWATGIPINTPCDGPNSQAGPLSQECLSYLYTNQGVNSHIGPTYTLLSSATASMKGQNTANTYCQPGTSLDPVTPAGLKFAQNLGGINAVKQTYDQINRLANDNTKTNSTRSQAVKQCYGVSIDKMPNMSKKISIIQPQGVFTVLGGTSPQGDSQTFYADSNLTNSNINWTKIPGGLNVITLAPNGALFGTTTSNTIYYLNKYNNWQPSIGWQQITGTLRNIFTDGNLVCGTDPNNNTFYAPMSAAIAGNWTKLPSSFQKIVTYNNMFYGLGLDSHIYYLLSPTGVWSQSLSSGTFKDINVDENGVLLMLGQDNAIFYSENGQGQQFAQVQTEPSTIQWQSMSISKGSIYAIDTTGQPWYLPNYKQSIWTKLVGSGQYIPAHRMTQV